MTGGPQVLVVGALHHDVVVRAERLPRLDETLVGQSVDYLCGGKGGNQAVAAARHGAGTALAARIGDDAAGQALLENLRAAGVDVSAVLRGRGQASGMSVAIVTGSGDYGAVIVSAANLGLQAETVAMPETVAVLLLQNEVPEAVNAPLAARARDRGISVLLNAAPARPFETDLLDAVDLLIVNRGEAAMLTGLAVETNADACAVAACLAAGGRAAILTLGAEGVAYATAQGEARHLPAPRVEVVSSHGAGDAFAGALAARLALGDEAAEALVYAQGAAALHVSRPVEARDTITPAAVRAFLSG